MTYLYKLVHTPMTRSGMQLEASCFLVLELILFSLELRWNYDSQVSTPFDVAIVQDCLVRTDRNWRACQAGEHSLVLHPDIDAKHLIYTYKR